MASKEEEPLAHDEIWDDSALVGSWNDALAEYKKYHSIHRKGGNVEHVLNLKQPEAGSDAKVRDEANVPEQDGLEPVSNEPYRPTSRGATIDSDEELENASTGNQPGSQQTEQAAFIPAPLLGSVHDESLKKLLMSWYYAGYYTGLYEGQQREPSSQQQ